MGRGWGAPLADNRWKTEKNTGRERIGTAVRGTITLANLPGRISLGVRRFAKIKKKQNEKRDRRW